MTHPSLSNAVWYALTGPQSHLSVGHAGARMFQVDVTPFCAVPDDPSNADWQQLAQLLPTGGGALFREQISLPDGWQRGDHWPCLQLVRTQPPVPEPILESFDTDVLTHNDLPEILDLVARTRPGPFLGNTLATGQYRGIRINGQLVAMAGERMRLPGATEISAVAVESKFRGQGLARQLITQVSSRITRRAEVPFLHVVETNEAAIRLYRSLGFEISRSIDALIVTGPGQSPPELR